MTTTTYAVPPAVTRSVAIIGTTDRFPVHRVYCVGRNYAAHAIEMGMNPEREEPFFFMKPGSAVVDASSPVVIPYPPMTAKFHYEIELVAAIGRGGADIGVDKALDHVFGYAVGLDMTRRDLQLAARDKGRPWEFGKSFAHSAPIGVISRAQEVGHLRSGAISLSVNGQPRQRSDIAKMIWSVAESIAFLSKYDALEPGDVLMTGTPEGVGAVSTGDHLVGTIDRLREIVVDIRTKRA
jgi:fumarylpyruvate hydrolase